MGVSGIGSGTLLRCRVGGYNRGGSAVEGCGVLRSHGPGVTAAPGVESLGLSGVGSDILLRCKVGGCSKGGSAASGFGWRRRSCQRVWYTGELSVRFGFGSGGGHSGWGQRTSYWVGVGLLSFFDGGSVCRGYLEGVIVHFYSRGPPRRYRGGSDRGGCVRCCGSDGGGLVTLGLPWLSTYLFPVSVIATWGRVSARACV